MRQAIKVKECGTVVYLKLNKLCIFSLCLQDYTLCLFCAVPLSMAAVFV